MDRLYAPYEKSLSGVFIRLQNPHTEQPYRALPRVYAQAKYKKMLSANCILRALSHREMKEEQELRERTPQRP